MSPGRLTQRSASVVALVVAVLLVLVLVGGDDPETHRLSVTVPEAANLEAGQFVREAGVPVGRVVSLDPVRGGRAARLELELDEKAWPVPADSRLQLRFAGTANFGNRYLRLDRGRATRTLGEGAAMPGANFEVPVEFDGLLRTFDAKMRRDVRAMLEEAGPALLTARPNLRRALDAAPPALEEANFVLEDLAAERRALNTLLDSSDRVLAAVDASRPGVRELLAGAAGTFDAIAGEERNLRTALDRAPVAFTQVRNTLARAAPTLDVAGDIARRLSPGVRELRRTSGPLHRVLTTITDVGPDARRTVRSLRAATPSLNPLVDKVGGLSPRLRSIGTQGQDNLKCIRPYTPDATAFFTNWGDFFSLPDATDKVIRAQVQTFLPTPSNTSSYNSGEAKRAFPDLEFGFPRPPGTNAGQPWFLPECGAGPDALDPNKDPEARTGSSAMRGAPLEPLSVLMGSGR